MASKLSFSIAINLLTENFKRGTNNVKAGFRAMQMQVLAFAAALGAGGLGLSNFVSRLIDVARETNRVTTALKNVSGSTGQFADNQRYLIDLAKKYGLEINALTGNYAKFTAAASISGMSMENQRKIFESVSRACTAFGMNAEDSNGVMLALSQMMSKGKISSEELRLQMGERLPVALQAMAKAAGVSVGGLDKLMKQGKLMSADVLPKFADALNEMIPNVDTDNLETSVNRLKNTFTEFANSLDIQSKYKSLVDGLTNAVSVIKNNVTGLVTFIITLISGKLFAGVVAYFSQFWKLQDAAVRKAETAEVQKLGAVQKRIEAEKLYEATLTDYNKIENGKRLASGGQLKKAENAMDVARLAEKKAILSASTATVNAAAVSTTTVWGKTMNTLKLGVAQFGRTLKAVFASSWPMVLITLIAGMIAKMVSMREEAKRIKRIFSDYKAEAEKTGNIQEVTVLKQQLKIMNDKKQSQENINNAQAELQKMLGKEYKTQDELNKAVAKRIELLKETARADFHSRKVVESEESLRDVGNKLYNGKTIREMAPDWGGARGNIKKEEAFKQKYGITSGFNELEFAFGDFKNDLDEYVELAKIWKHSNEELEKSQIAANKIVKNPATPPNSDPDDKKTDLQKAETEYRASLQKYKNQLDAGAITQDKYNEEVYKLNSDTVSKFSGILGKSADANEIYATALFNTLTPLVNDEAKAKADLVKVESNYNDALKLAKAKLDKKIISEDEYREAIVNAATFAAESAISIKNIGNAADEFINKVQGVAISKIEAPVRGKRDTTFDYKLSDSDKISGELDVWKKYKDELESLKEKHHGLSVDLQNELNKAIANVDNLEDALKIAEVNEDIKSFNKELQQSMYSGIKDIASSSDRIVSAFTNLRDVLNDADSTEWEKIMSVWNAMTNVADSIMSIINTVENITDIVSKLSGAKKEQERLAESTGKTAVSKGVEIVADQVATQLTIENSKKKTEAAMAEMAAKSTAAYADIPFVGLGLAAGQIAAMTAMIEAATAKTPGFNNGGIYLGGTSFGDKGVARLNKGEMILNMSQQANLFDAINSGGLGGSSHVTVEFGKARILGPDILLSLNNTLRKQGKKPIS